MNQFQYGFLNRVDEKYNIFCVNRTAGVRHCMALFVDGPESVHKTADVRTNYGQIKLTSPVQIFVHPDDLSNDN